MRNKKPTKTIEKEWLQRVADHGCVVNGNSQVQLHHPVGREGKQDKTYIGRFFVIPLSPWLHDVDSMHPWNVTHRRKNFIKEFGLESELWYKMVLKLAAESPLPFGRDIIDAVMATKR
tara:strand:+ start:1406 stop:1759 length:354 start_codon:yes stop_codon:yes gene_type:complete